MNEYIDKLSFDRKIKSSFEIFCLAHNLQLYQSNQGVSLSLESINKPNYLNNFSKVEPEPLTCSGIWNKNSGWNYLSVPTAYQEELTKILLKGLKKEERKLFYKYATKFIFPDVIASTISSNLDELETFLTIEKSTKSKYWLKEDILDYVVLLFNDKDKEQKYHVLNNTLKNNKLYLNTFEQKDRLYKFVNLHIDAQYKEKFSHFYEEVGKFNNNQVNLFNYPQDILNIDLHKVSFSQCFKVKASDTYITKFLNSLIYLVEKKDTMKLLGASSLEVSQKTQMYDYYRLIFTPIEGYKLNAELIEGYIKNFIQAYSNEGAPDKTKLNSMNRKIVLSMGLNNTLEIKNNVTKKNKI